MQSPRETADILFASSNLNPLNILSTADSLRHHCKLGLLRLRRSSASIPGTNVHRRPKSKDGVGGSFLLAAASATSTAWATCVCRACSSIWLDERRMKAKRPEDRRASSPPCPPHAGAKHASSAARTSARILLCLVSSCVAFARKNAIFRETVTVRGLICFLLITTPKIEFS